MFTQHFTFSLGWWLNNHAVGKAPGDWRTPGRFAHAGAITIAPASWSAAALRRFWIYEQSEGRNGTGLAQNPGVADARKSRADSKAPVGRAVLCAPLTANGSVRVHHGGAHGVVRPTFAPAFCSAEGSRQKYFHFF